MMRSLLQKTKLAIYRVIKEGGRPSKLNEIFEYVISGAICLNVILIVFESMGINGRYGVLLHNFRVGFFIFFLIEYILRIFIADIVMREKRHPILARIRYIFTLRALVDLLALLPVMLGSTFIDFRIFRVLRLLRVTQLTSLRRYTIILEKVLALKKAQLWASLFIAFVFMLASAVIIYDFEHKAQPETFNNILSCLWWAMSSITTVGYGDMYPVTPLGKIFGSCMSVFGVFLMAIPVGILTSGFFEVAKKIEEEKNKE